MDAALQLLLALGQAGGAEGRRRHIGLAVQHLVALDHAALGGRWAVGPVPVGDVLVVHLGATLIQSRRRCVIGLSPI